MKEIDPRVLADWESALTTEIGELRKKREQLDAELQRTSRKLELIRQMRSLEQPAHKPEPNAASHDSKATPFGVREAAAKILLECGKPLHISEIHRAFLDRGYAIPGKGTPFNILAHMVNDKNFARTSRGTYALRDAVAPEQIMPKAAPRRRKRRPHRKFQGSQTE
jgi:HB1/ASXL restriction endonuclease-like protein with HTH domain